MSVKLNWNAVFVVQPYQMASLSPSSLGLFDTLAYIDAGAGSMLLQAAAAGFLTGAFFIKTQWKTLKSKVSGFVNNRKRAR